MTTFETQQGPLATVRLASDLLRVDIERLEELIPSGDLKIVRIGNKSFIDIDEAERLTREVES